MAVVKTQDRDGLGTVRVDLGERSYYIRIEAGLLDQAGSLTAGVVSSRHAVLLTHPVIWRFHGDRVRSSLVETGFTVAPVMVPAGERTKSMTRLTSLLRAMLDAGLDRRSALVALGGGVIGDLGGLAAALYMRGIPFVQIPTSLLAMVDSSVGGKTAVDLDHAKNAVGAFHQPRLVMIDPDVLTTLPVREVRAGLAEVIKYGILGDAAFFHWLRDHSTELLALERSALSHAIRRSCENKANIVERDELDRSDIRASLNFGHTIGHALETVGGLRLYRHGEAVALGMIAAARISEATGIAEEPLVGPIVSILGRFGLPTAPKRIIDEDAILEAMNRDKKTMGGTFHFVLPRRIGEVVVRPVEGSVIHDVLRRWD